MLPVTHGVEFTRLQILFYTVLMVLVSILPYLTGMSGLIYLVAAVSFGGRFLYYSIAMMRSEDPALPMRTFRFSIVYLMGVFSALLIDHYAQLLA
jgi:heme o synthase